MPTLVTARAPGKVIVLGEHAVNRGQPALAASVGLYATCTLRQTDAPGIVFRSDATGYAEERAERTELLRLAKDVDDWRAAEDYESIRDLAGRDFFAPQKYVVASALRDSLPEGLELTFTSQLPRSCGLGSGGAAFAALAAALGALTGLDTDRERVADWAHRGDVLSHGGVASRLDSQTALRGGVIRFTLERNVGEPVPFDPSLSLVIGNSNVIAATSEVNARVRRWLAEDPTGRQRYFESIGVLSRAALPPLAAGDWPELGRLLTLNQLVLEKIGVSTPALDALIDAAHGAGAYGAKLAGSGGGGIMFALADASSAPTVAAAIRAAGGTPLTPALAVTGAEILEIR